MASRQFDFFPMHNGDPGPRGPSYPPEHVWRVYRNEAIAQDEAMLNGWQNTVNILLTFAGLFSATVTAFIIESYKFLHPDELGLSSALSVPAKSDRDRLVQQSSQTALVARWINGLWFTSLLLSLATAFFCILGKQWLDGYALMTSPVRGSPRDWALRHHYFSHAFNLRGMQRMMLLIPVLLHIALFLFFAGMVALLWLLDIRIAAWILCLTVVLILPLIASYVVPYLWKVAPIRRSRTALDLA